MRKKEIMLTTKAIFDARDSNAYKNHREFVEAAFKHYHNIEIDPQKFGELIFDYHGNGNVVITAHSGAYHTARD